PQQHAYKDKWVLTDHHWNYGLASDPPQIKEHLSSTYKKEQPVIQNNEMLLSIDQDHDPSEYLTLDLNLDDSLQKTLAIMSVMNSEESEPNLQLFSHSTHEDSQRKTRRGGSRSTKQDKNITQPRQRAGKRHAKDVQKPSKLIRNCNSDRGEKSLKCDTCGKRFKFKSTLHIHIRIHTGEKPYVCKTCGKSFTQQGHLSSHILIHTGEKPYVCLTCKKGFLRKKSLRDHMTIHTGLQPHVCVTCEKGFILKKDFTAHIRTHNAEKHTHVQKPSKLKRNCNSDRGEKSLKCDTCGKRFKFKSTLHIHIRIHTGEKPYVCKTCGKYFTQQGHLSSHILIHTGEKPYVCLTCKKGFLRKKSLRDHMIIHTGLQPHVCVTCEKGFILKDLTAHIRTHNAEKPHTKAVIGLAVSCRTGEKPDACKASRGKYVQKPSKLKRNCNSDRGEKSLKCDTCGKRFKFKSTLHIHILIHTGEKPYVCKTCGKSFTQQGHLSSHILIHTGEKPYVCLTCKKGFLRKKSLYSLHIAQNMERRKPLRCCPE
uniref:C2H2-type domain-containing protein n=1 Tax=Takifugu rubripes TaxID=31033 RepID=A0A674N6U9_TAKRU